MLDQHIMSFLKGLAGLEMFPPTQAPTNPSVSRTATKMGEVGGNNAFFRSLLGPVMSSNEHDMLIKILKLKPSIFLGFETKYAYEFILYCYDRLHKLGFIHQHGVEFVSFQL